MRCDSYNLSSTTRRAAILRQDLLCLAMLRETTRCGIQSIVWPSFKNSIARCLDTSIFLPYREKVLPKTPDLTQREPAAFNMCYLCNQAWCTGFFQDAIISFVHHKNSNPRRYFFFLRGYCRWVVAKSWNPLAFILPTPSSYSFSKQQRRPCSAIAIRFIK